MATPHEQQQHNDEYENDDQQQQPQEQEQERQKGQWSPDAKYQNALKRADKKGIDVRGDGYRKSDGAHVWAVPSQRDPNHWHLVVLEQRGFVCDCEAQENGRYCLHRAVARRRYQLEVQAIRKWEADQAAFAQQRKEQQMGKDLERSSSSTMRQQPDEGQA